MGKKFFWPASEKSSASSRKVRLTAAKAKRRARNFESKCILGDFLFPSGCSRSHKGGKPFSSLNPRMLLFFRVKSKVKISRNAGENSEGFVT